MRVVCQDVSKRIAGRFVLRDVCMEALDGERLALVGPSGAGKTTLLHILAGLERVDEGRVLFADAIMSSASAHVPPEQRHIGLVFQDRALWPHLTAAQHFRLVTRGRTEGCEVLERLRMAPLLHRRPDEMSGGEAQRLAVALSIANEPRLLLLDEPRGQIDPDSLALLDELLDEFLERTHTTCILVTHSGHEAARWAQRVALIDEGTIVQQAPFEELYRQPVSAVVARQTGDVALVVGVMTDADIARTSLGPIQTRRHAVNGLSVVLVIRPEQVVCDPDGPILARAACSRFVQGRWLVELTCQAEKLYGYFERSVDIGPTLKLRIVDPVWAIPSGSARLVGGR